MAKPNRGPKRGASRPPPPDHPSGAAAPNPGSAAEAATRAPEHVEIPRWLPPVVFAVVALVLFRRFVFSGEMLYGADTEGLGYMARAFYAEALKGGDFPLWNPIILGGTPFLESLAGGDSLYPPSLLLLLLLEPFRALGWKLVLHVFFAGLFTYGWTRTLGCSRAAALVAGLGYMVAPFFVTLVFPAHDGKMFVTALTPLLFWAVEAWFARGRWSALAGIGAVVAVTILTTHFQMAYFLFGAVGAYALFRTVSELRARARARASAEASTEPAIPSPPSARMAHPGMRFTAFVAISFVGAGAAAVQLLPALDYIGDASRRSSTTTQASSEANRVYASSWGMHPEEAVSSLLVPEFVGASTYNGRWTEGTYWGRNAFKYNSEYMGLALLLLAELSFFGARRKGLRLFFATLAGIAFLYTLNEWTPIWGLMYGIVPGLKLFRAPSMVIFLSGFGLTTLAAFGVDRALAWTTARRPDEGRNGQRFLWGATGVLGVGMLLASSGVLLSMWQAIFSRPLEAQKAQALQTLEPYITQGFLIATAVAAAVAALVWAGRGGWLKASGVVGLLACVIVFDGARISDRFLLTRDFDEFTARDANVDYLLAQQATNDPFRVLDLGGGQPLGPEVRLGMWGLELAGGHHPNDLRRYRELTGMMGGGSPENLFRSPNINRLLGVRYVVWPARQFGPMEEQEIPGFPVFEPVSATQLQGGVLYEVVYATPALDRARLVGRAELVDDDRAVARIMEATFDPATTVVLSPSAEALDLELGSADPQGSVEWLEDGPDRIRLRVTSDADAILAVAENYYPTWHATVDGVEVPVLRAYHTLQALPVPAGSHEVVLEVRTDGPVRTGMMVSTVSWLLLAGLAVGSRARSTRRDDDDV